MGTIQTGGDHFFAEAQNEFAARAESYRRELQVHCYRMLGSLQDAEDLVQETMLRAWQKRAALREQASLRAWLYKIATNVCLDALERAPRRKLPTQYAPAGNPHTPPQPPLFDRIWLDPLPDTLRAESDTDPEARYSRHESVSLAFLVALQTLPPRQRAVLILRDVLEWSAEETAQLLSLTVPAVNSALHRARVAMSKQYRPSNVESLGLRADDARVRVLLERYVRAWEDANVDALLSVLREDATLLMPPSPTWFQGKNAIAAFAQSFLFRDKASGRLKLIRTSANDAPAFAWYQRDDRTNTYRAVGIQTVEIREDLYAGGIVFMNPALFRFFDLPETIGNENVQAE